MRHRLQLSMRIAAVAALALVTASCGDSESPTEPGPGPSVSIAGTWRGGVFDGCQTVASFIEHGVDVVGTLQLVDPCRNTFDFHGRLQGNRLSGTFTDYEIFLLQAHGTVTGSTLEISLTDAVGTEYARLRLHR